MLKFLTRKEIIKQEKEFRDFCNNKDNYHLMYNFMNIIKEIRLMEKFRLGYCYEEKCDKKVLKNHCYCKVHLDKIKRDNNK